MFKFDKEPNLNNAKTDSENLSKDIEKKREVSKEQELRFEGNKNLRKPISEAYNRAMEEFGEEVEPEKTACYTIFPYDKEYDPSKPMLGSYDRNKDRIELYLNPNRFYSMKDFEKKLRQHLLESEQQLDERNYIWELKGHVLKLNGFVPFYEIKDKQKLKTLEKCHEEINNKLWDINSKGLLEDTIIYLTKHYLENGRVRVDEHFFNLEQNDCLKNMIDQAINESIDFEKIKRTMLHEKIHQMNYHSFDIVKELYDDLETIKKEVSAAKIVKEFKKILENKEQSLEELIKDKNKADVLKKIWNIRGVDELLAFAAVEVKLGKKPRKEVIGKALKDSESSYFDNANLLIFNYKDVIEEIRQNGYWPTARKLFERVENVTELDTLDIN